MQTWLTRRGMPLRVYTEGGKVVLEPVPLLEAVLKDLEEEARGRGLTREELEREIGSVRERLVRELYGE